MAGIAHREGLFAGSGGLNLSQQSWAAEGVPHRAATIIVHGVGEHSGAYGNVVERLAPAGFVAYGFDLRGHGRSPGQRGFITSWEDYRQDVHAFVHFVSTQQPAQPLFLLGHSLGGIIVLDYALRHPEDLRGVVAIAPAIGEVGVSPALMTIARIMSRAWPSFSLPTGLDVTAISRDLQFIAAYRADPLMHDRGTARLAAETERTVAWVQAHAGELRVPLLIQHGDADRIAHPGGSRRFVVHAGTSDKTLHEYPGAFHQVHNDVGHETVTVDLLAWLERRLDDLTVSDPR